MSPSSERHPYPMSYDTPPETRGFWGGNLPHWDVLGRPIFLTLHVRGAIPAQAAARIREKAAAFSGKSPLPAEAGYSSPRLPSAGSTYTRRLKLIFKEMEAWLDRVDHEPLLTNPEVAAMLAEAIAERESRRWWRILHWTAMPSHLHVLYVGGRVGMKRLMEDLKRWTGHQAAKILGRDGRRFWQDEWFDHWSRSADETDRIESYIRMNPVRAGLIDRWEDWPHASWAGEPALGKRGLQDRM